MVMVVCGSCELKMVCIKTGADISFQNGHHVYPSDRYECPKCKSVVNISNSSPLFDPNPEPPEEFDVWMS